MFNPFQIYLEKKHRKRKKESASPQGDDDNDDETNETIDEYFCQEVLQKWNGLSDKKKLKFVKKAERRYDQCEDEDKGKLHQYLTEPELDLLIKSYEFPEKPPPYVGLHEEKKKLHKYF